MAIPLNRYTEDWIRRAKERGEITPDTSSAKYSYLASAGLRKLWDSSKSVRVGDYDVKEIEAARTILALLKYLVVKKHHDDKDPRNRRVSPLDIEQLLRYAIELDV